MSRDPKHAASENLNPQEQWDDLLLTRRGIDELLKQGEQTGDLKSAQDALDTLQLKTSNYAKLVEEMQAPMKAVLGNHFLGTAEWQQVFGVNAGVPPPIPENVTADLLNSHCPLHPGKRIKETHILILIPKTVDGKPYNALKLAEFCETWLAVGHRLIYVGKNEWKRSTWAKTSPSQSEWILIPKSDPDPSKVPKKQHFRGKTIAKQAEVYKHYATNYREAKALELMTAAVLNAVVRGERILPTCYLRTAEENADGGRVVLGCFAPYGLEIDLDNKDIGRQFVGAALVRKT